MSELVKEWEKAKKVLKAAQDKEKSLREQVLNEYWGGYENGAFVGTQTEELTEGVKLKASFVIKYEADKDASKIQKLIDTAKPELQDSLRRLFKMKFDISVSEYKTLAPNVKKVVDKVITTKLNSPQIEVVRK